MSFFNQYTEDAKEIFKCDIEPSSKLHIFILLDTRVFSEKTQTYEEVTYYVIYNKKSLVVEKSVEIPNFPFTNLYKFSATCKPKFGRIPLVKRPDSPLIGYDHIVDRMNKYLEEFKRT